MEEFTSDGSEQLLHLWVVPYMNPQQARRKQSPDGQAQLDVGGEAANNSRAKRAAKI